MLARSFLTPTELKIRVKEFDALGKVLGMLERGELNQGFVMDEWPGIGCGTVGCIGFWTEKLIGEEVKWYDNLQLNNLFFINERIRNYYDGVGPEHAAHALRNYLTTGKADWASVLA